MSVFRYPNSSDSCSPPPPPPPSASTSSFSFSSSYPAAFSSVRDLIKIAKLRNARGSHDSCASQGKSDTDKFLETKTITTHCNKTGDEYNDKSITEDNTDSAIIRDDGKKSQIDFFQTSQFIFNLKDTSLEGTIEGYRLSGPTKSVFYIPQWIDDLAEENLLKKIESSHENAVKLSGRKTYVFGGKVTSEGLTESQSLPHWLDVFAARMCRLGIFEESKKPNHVLVNQYYEGSGILFHTDGPAYHPVVAILSLGGSCVFEFKIPPNQKIQNKESEEEPASNKKEKKIFVAAKSLFVFQEEFYTDFLHGISDLTEDVLDEEVSNVPPELQGKTVERGFRVSLTFRHVPLKT